MNDEKTYPIPLADVRVGWEPIAEFSENLPEAEQFLRDQRGAARRVMVVVNPAGHYSVWTKRHRCWPFTPPREAGRW